jgi:hypothetical protein
MAETETLEFVVDEDRITYPANKPWLEAWYGIWLTIALPKLTAAGWQVLATRPMVGLTKSSTLYVMQRQNTNGSQRP